MWATEVHASTISVAAGGDLQAALNAAQPGDVILLQAGATFKGNFILPVKGGSSMITIRSSAADASLPAADLRVSPADAPLLPKIVSPNTASALVTAPGAHHYTLQFLEFLANFQGYGDIIALGDGSGAQNTLASVPHDLVVDRVYIHGDVTFGQKRGIALNSGSTSIVNSYIAEIKAAGQDSQAIASWNGPGPYTITNNYLEAAGENIIFGGSDPAITNLVASDVVVRGNYFAKQLAWRGQGWVVKNLFELKNAQRVVVDANLMEYNWLDGQVGIAVQLTPRNQDGGCPWCVVQHVQFTNNVVSHAGGGINILGVDNNHPSQVANDILIRNNLFTDITGATWGGHGWFVQIGAGAVGVTIDHNTVFQDGTSALYAYDAPETSFTFTNNIVPDNSWAIMGGGTSPGNGTIATYFPGGVFLKGVYAGSNPSVYPAGNYFPASMSAVGFVDLTGGDYRLASTSPYHNGATDGTDVGCILGSVAGDVVRTGRSVKVTSVALATNLAAPQTLGATVTWTATPAGGAAPYQYLWWVFDGVNWTAAGSWTASNTFAWTPAFPNSDYAVDVWVKSAGNSASQAESQAWAPFPIAASGVQPVPSWTRTLVWRNKTTGQNFMWIMNGLSVASAGTVAPTIADASWQVKAVADLNGDGNADLVWRNQTTGQNIVWFLNGTTLLGASMLPTVADLNWEIKGVRDFNGDGRADFLWRNKVTGENVVWLMNGAAVAAADFLPRVADFNWEIAGLGDLNGDGKTDILWRNKATGDNVGWLMNGTALAGADFLPRVDDFNWEIKGLADMDGDGRADIIWRHKTAGLNVVWRMSGCALTAASFIPAMSDAGWQIARVGDLDGDGKADILWHNTATGATTVWLMNGFAVQSSAALGNVSDQSWELVAR